MKTTAPNTLNKREEKKQVNIPWNSRLNFQMGIIISCLIVFFIMQTSFETTEISASAPTSFGIQEPPMIIYDLDVEKPAPIAVVKTKSVKPISIPKRVNPDVLIVKMNSSPETETEIPSVDSPVTETETPDAPEPNVPGTSVPETTGPSSIMNVEYVPVYPGCEGLGSNAEKIDCLSSKINVFINRNFRKELLEDLERNQIQKVYVQFKIDSQGFVTEVRANSLYENLKKEAQRVVANLPKMKPGRQGDKNVDVLYTIPIVFQMQ